MFEGVTVAAVCDLRPERGQRATKHLVDAGKPQPAVYSKNADDYKRMLARDDLDAVIISTPWDLHARMAVDSMRAGKFTGVETPIALTVDECWEVVKAHESTGVACMMFENWAFRRDNLAVLNMIRAGLFGRIVHGHCSYSHNCLHWIFSPDRTWLPPHFINKNVSQYSTHGMGPIVSWMDINCGDRIDYIVSVASEPLGIKDQLARRRGADDPLAKQDYKQGDIVTTVARTVRGKTLVVNCDILLPRPYNNRWMIQGTRGLYNEQRQAVFIDGKTHGHDPWQPFATYEKQYEHRFWKHLTEKQRAIGHGGTDFVVMNEFLRAVRRAFFSHCEKACRNSPNERPASAREMVVSQGGFSRLKPSGSFNWSQCAVAQRSKTAISVIRDNKPRKTSYTIPSKGCLTPRALRGSVICENTSRKSASDDATTTNSSMNPTFHASS